MCIFRNIKTRCFTIVFFIITVSSIPSWAQTLGDPANQKGYFEHHFGLLCLVWFALLVALSALAWKVQDSLLEGNLGSRFIFSVFLLLNSVLLLVPLFFPSEVSWWIKVPLMFIIFGIISYSFLAIGNFIFLTSNQEKSREEKTFSTVVHYEVLSGEEALQIGFDRFVGAVGISFLVCISVFIAHLFLKDYVPQETKNMNSLLQEANTLLDNYESKIEGSMLFLTKDKKVTELQILRVIGEDQLKLYKLSKGEHRLGLCLKANNYSLTIPLSCLESMVNTNTKHGRYKNMQVYVFNVTYMINGEIKTILAYPFGHPPQFLCGTDIAKDTTKDICMDLKNVVTLKNLTTPLESYDPAKYKDENSHYFRALFHFHDGEILEFESPFIGGNTQEGGKLFFCVYDKPTNKFIEIPYDEIDTIHSVQDKDPDDLNLELIIVKKTGEKIKGSLHLGNGPCVSSFIGISPAGWVNIDLKKMKRIEFKDHIELGD